jgi:hypothetical protein
VQRLLAGPGQAAATRTVVLRDPQPGDMGWVVQQHGEIYAREYGWNSEFEALVADIAGKYLKNFQPDWEKCWIAELDGERVGAVFVVRKSATVAQLRMLILTPGRRAAWAWAGGSRTNASPSRAPRATKKWCSGPTAAWRRRAPSTPNAALNSSRASRIRVLGGNWLARPGSAKALGVQGPEIKALSLSPRANQQ